MSASVPRGAKTTSSLSPPRTPVAAPKPAAPRAAPPKAAAVPPTEASLQNEKIQTLLDEEAKGRGDLAKQLTMLESILSSTQQPTVADAEKWNKGAGAVRVGV
jgi:hypothetical protein